MTSKYSSWRKSVSIDPIDILNDKNDATLLPTRASIQEKHETGPDKELHFADVDVDADSNSLK